jgi:hypothetical protein
MLGIREDLIHRARLDDSSPVHHRHLVDQIADDPEVVGHVDERDLALPYDFANDIQEPGLRRDVKPRGRLIHDHDARSTDERQRDRNSLLLTTAQLMRISSLERDIVRQLRFAQRLRDADRRIRLAPGMDLDHLAQGMPYSHPRTEAGGRILWHVGDVATSSSPAFVLPQREDVDTVEDDLSPRDDRARTRETEQSHRRGRLPRARLADNRQLLAGVECERHILDDRERLILPAHTQVSDIENTPRVIRALESFVRAPAPRAHHPTPRRVASDRTR